MCVCIFIKVFYNYGLRFLVMELFEFDYKFVEIVKVGRDYYWFLDVIIYYKLEIRSKLIFFF